MRGQRSRAPHTHINKDRPRRENPEARREKLRVSNGQRNHGRRASKRPLGFRIRSSGTFQGTFSVSGEEETRLHNRGAHEGMREHYTFQGY